MGNEEVVEGYDMAVMMIEVSNSCPEKNRKRIG